MNKLKESIDKRCRERKERLRKLKETGLKDKPLINRDYIPNRYSTIPEFFDSLYCSKSASGYSGVYFLTFVGDESKIKIGKGQCLDSRVRSYLTHTYRPIKILCCVYSKTDYEGILEKDFHDFFFESRYDREWFNSTDFLLNSIEEIKKINKFMPFIVPRKGEDIYEDPDYLMNKLYETTN